MCAFPIPETLETTILKPLGAREVHRIHVDTLVNNRSLIQRDPTAYEDRCEQTPHCLLLRACCLEWFHLQLDKVLSKKGPEVGLLVILWLINTLHVN